MARNRRVRVWLELPVTRWGEPAYVLVGALSHSGRIRAVVSDGMDFAHLVACLDGVLRRLGGTARSWRTDRMATIVEPGTDRRPPDGEHRRVVSRAARSQALKTALNAPSLADPDASGDFP